MYSVVVLTLNEEGNLPACLASVAGCDDVVVLDSGSTDRTHEVALAAGARVVTNRFTDFAQQRNFAHRDISFRHAWVFHLDADERMTPELDAECRRVAEADTRHDGYWAAPRMLFEGKWIRRSTDFPAWQARFARVQTFRFIQVGHGQREDPSMRMGFLRGNYIHDIFSHGEAAWIQKHRGYARAEAVAIRAAGNGSGPGWAGMFGSDPLERRRALKRLSYGLPGRPALRFLYQYILRAGFLDGRAGLRYCRLLAQYEKWATAELRHLRR